MTLGERLAGLAGIHQSIAGDVWPNGATLRCGKCGRTQDASTKECGQYLRSGWPKCCGYTMTLEQKS